jgi:hypothetical protein
VKAVESFELWLRCSKAHPDVEHEDPLNFQGLQGAISRLQEAISQLRQNASQVPLPETKQGIQGWLSKAVMIAKRDDLRIVPLIVHSIAIVALVGVLAAWATYVAYVVRCLFT